MAKTPRDRSQATNGMRVNSNVRAGENWWQHYSQCRRDHPGILLSDLGCTVGATWHVIQHTFDNA